MKAGYPAIFTNESLEFDGLTDGLSRIGRAECACRLNVPPMEADLADPICSELRDLMTASGNQPTPAAVGDVFARHRDSLTSDEKADIFGLQLESYCQHRDYAAAMDAYEKYILPDAALRSVRADYFRLISLMAMNRLSDAVEIGLEAVTRWPDYGFLFLYQCGQAARSAKDYDSAGRYFVESFLRGDHFGPPLVEIGFLAKLTGEDTARHMYDALGKVQTSGYKPTHKGFYNALASLAARLDLGVEEVAYNRLSAEVLAGRKIARNKGRLLAAPLDEPGFIILGMPKCGTTSVYSFISRHPHVLAASRKEINFFNTNYAKGFDWYRSHFVNAELGDGTKFVTGEATPGYFNSVESLSRISADCKSARLLALFRNPVARAISVFYQRKKMVGMNIGIDEFFSRELSRDGGMSSPILVAGMYVKMLAEWVKNVGWQRIHVVNSDQLFAQPEIVMNGVFEFLGLDQNLVKMDFPKANVGAYPKASPELLDRLAAFYVGPNRELFDYLGRDFGWNGQRLY